MAVNADKPHLWKADTLESIDFYNDWFLRFAPTAFRTQRSIQTEMVTNAFQLTDNLRTLSTKILRENPGILPMLRMTSAPPLARDRLVGLAYTSKNLVQSMEGKDETPSRLPPRMSDEDIESHLSRIVDVLREVADRDLFPWLDDTAEEPSEEEVLRSASVVADRLCGAAADPIIRNEQEKRQLGALSKYLDSLGYKQVEIKQFDGILAMPQSTYCFRANVSVGSSDNPVNIPIDCIISRKSRLPDEVPILIEAKSAGDATNTNKRRKEEAQKLSQLKKTFGQDVVFILFLCGYFETGYLGYEASEGIDWVWEHRISDLLLFLDEDFDTTPSSAKENSTEYSSGFLQIEQERFRRQKDIDDSRSPLDRNRMGQFSTPFRLANEITRYSCSLCNKEPDELRILEPAVGSGVFLSSFLGAGIIKPTFAGVEIDNAYSKIAEELFSDLNLSVFNQDFFDFCADDNYSRNFHLVVTNPPYVRHHHIESSKKVEFQSRVHSELGITVSGLAGLYIYYMLLCDKLLAADAVSSWLIPTEFLYTNYGASLRHYLTRCVRLNRIHLFSAEDVQFDDALVSSCVITFTKKSPSENDQVLITRGSYLVPTSEDQYPISKLQPDEKWIFSDSRASSVGEYKLEDLFHITRGLATGNNEYFILTKDKVNEQNIPSSALRPVLPSPRYLDHEVIESSQDGIPDCTPQLFLLNISEPEEQIKKDAPSLYDYIQRGRSEGVSDGYLCRSRKIWYQQEERKPSLFLASYMGRGRNGSKPIRFFLNRSQALATNVYICLYPRPFVADAIAEDPERANDLLEILNDISNDELRNSGRSYGGGLQKIEPKELRAVRISKIPDWVRLTRTEQTELFQEAQQGGGLNALTRVSHL